MTYNRADVWVKNVNVILFSIFFLFLLCVATYAQSPSSQITLEADRVVILSLRDAHRQKVM